MNSRMEANLNRGSNNDLSCASSLRAANKALMLISRPPITLPFNTGKPRSGRQPSSKNARPLKPTKAVPASLASCRFWRTPTQTSAAPSTAQAAEVQRASKASGIAMVAKPTASAMYDSINNRNDSPLLRHNQMAVSA